MNKITLEIENKPVSKGKLLPRSIDEAWWPFFCSAHSKNITNRYTLKEEVYILNEKKGMYA